MRRTADATLDQDFEYVGTIVKSYVDEKTGKRYIVGAASGLEEDKDGERVSKRAITGMVNAVGAGAVKLTGGTHDQNWLTEIGDAIEARIDPETDQFMVKTELPPEGADPIADKAWKETHKRKMGFSVGGKLRSAYFELTELGKKRKVLDSIDLRHLCLTDKPAYQHSFAEAVAKTFDGDPAEGEFTLEVEKDTTSGSWVPGGGGNSGQDSNTGGQRNAGTKKPGSKGPNVQDDRKTDNQDDDEKTLEPASRHLSCPNCGHEFAADIPLDMTPEERSKQEEQKQDSEKQQGGSTTSKSKEAEMDETAVEKRIKALEDLVAKQAADADRHAAETVAKGKISDDVLKVASEEGIDPGVLKVVALATGDHEERIEKTRQELSEGFDILGKAVMEIRETIGKLPTGRKSVARILPEATGHTDVGKTEVEEELAKAESPVEALKIMNRETYGIQ
jgi:hypothetical protein